MCLIFLIVMFLNIPPSDIKILVANLFRYLVGFFGDFARVVEANCAATDFCARQSYTKNSLLIVANKIHLRRIFL